MTGTSMLSFPSLINARASCFPYLLLTANASEKLLAGLSSNYLEGWYIPDFDSISLEILYIYMFIKWNNGSIAPPRIRIMT